MFGIPADQVIPIAQFIGIGLLGILAYFGQRWGKTKPTPAERQIEVAGAIVDNGAVRELAAALVAHTAMLAAQRVDAEKERQAQYRLAEVANAFMGKLDGLTDEIADLRRALAEVANQVARMK